MFSTTAAQVWAENGSAATAINELNSIIAESRKYGYIAAGLEARLALGELQMKAGKTKDGVLSLSALQRDATERGYKLVASKAKAVRDESKREDHKISASR